jgi:hypothetical protein
VSSTWRIEVLRRQQLLVVVGIRHGRERVVVLRVDAGVGDRAMTAVEATAGGEEKGGVGGWVRSIIGVSLDGECEWRGVRAGC